MLRDRLQINDSARCAKARRWWRFGGLGGVVRGVDGKEAGEPTVCYKLSGGTQRES